MKRQLAALLLTIFALSLTACGETAAESETRTVYAMDTVMNLTVYGENAAAALESAEKELHTKPSSRARRRAVSSMHSTRRTARRSNTARMISYPR